MQATAFMALRDVWQMVCGFEGEIFKQCGGHHETLCSAEKTGGSYRKASFFSLTKTVMNAQGGMMGREITGFPDNS
jgi:hypothetical protein